MPSHQDSQCVLDTIRFASEMGRLEYVSIVLAVLTIIIGMFGLFGFGYIRYMSKQHAEKVANEHMQAAMPEIIQEYREWLQNMIDSKDANEMASVQKKEENDVS